MIIGVMAVAHGEEAMVVADLTVPVLMAVAHTVADTAAPCLTVLPRCHTVPLLMAADTARPHPPMARPQLLHRQRQLPLSQRLHLQHHPATKRAVKLALV